MILAVSENLDELLQDGGLAAVAALGELGGVVVVAKDLPVMLVVAVLRAEDGWTYRACKVVDVILPIQSRDVGSSQGTSAMVTEEAETAKVVGFTKRVLALAVLIVGRKELRSHNLAAILTKSQCQRSKRG